MVFAVDANGLIYVTRPPARPILCSKAGDYHSDPTTFHTNPGYITSFPPADLNQQPDLHNLSTLMFGELESRR